MDILLVMLKVFGLSFVGLLMIYFLLYMLIALSKVLWEELKK